MGWLRGLGRLTGAVVWVVAMAPALALLSAAVFDRGPGGEARASLFPAALVALDPFVWECARNSLAMAAAVTIAARVVGVGVARRAVRCRFRGRMPLAALACAGLAVPPAFGAVGLGWLFAPRGPWSGWVAWFWVALATGAPLVGLATASALARIDPVWEDAARLAGANPGRVWRQFVWPVVRPDVGRALAAVFTLTLFEPGAPLALGLRRTLAFQGVESALGGGVGQLSRAAVLALAAASLAAAVRLIVGWLVGPSNPVPSREILSIPRAATTSWGPGVGFVVVLLLATAAAWVPIVGLLAAACQPAWTGPSGATWPWVSFAGFVAVFHDPLTRGYLTNSAALGVGVVVLDLVTARALAAWTLTRRGRHAVDRLAEWPAALPPLAVGVGVLAVPGMLRMALDALRMSENRRPLWQVFEAVVDAFDPDRTPWVALIVAVGVVRLPLLARSALDRRRGLRPVLVDAAVSLGATRRQARRTLSGHWLGVPPTAAIVTLALASTNVAPALLLAPTAETRPLGPAVLSLANEPGGGRNRAAALASMAVVVNLATLALAARGRSGAFRQLGRGSSGFRGPIPVP